MRRRHIGVLVVFLIMAIALFGGNAPQASAATNPAGGKDAPVPGGTAGSTICCPLGNLEAGQVVSNSTVPTDQDKILIDNRTQSPAGVPFDWVVSLTIDGDPDHCSGFLIATGSGGSQTVITAGHCLFNATTGTWVTTVEVTPGKNTLDGSVKRPKPFETQTADKIWSVKGWVGDPAVPNSAGDACYDYGAVQVPKPFRDPNTAVPLRGFLYKDVDPLDFPRSELAGYPQDSNGVQMYDGFGPKGPPPTTTPKTGVYKVLSLNCRTAGDPTNLLANYTNSTCPGSSGSPVWDPTDSNKVFAIHSQGADTTARSPRDLTCNTQGGATRCDTAPGIQPANCGRRIDAAVQANFGYWLKQAAAKPPVGGISLDPQLPGSSGSDAWLVEVLAGGMAVVVMASGGLWYARRRRVK